MLIRKPPPASKIDQSICEVMEQHTYVADSLVCSICGYSYLEGLSNFMDNHMKKFGQRMINKILSDVEHDMTLMNKLK